jgi:tRNA dimethylallyltransferase
VREDPAQHVRSNPTHRPEAAPRQVAVVGPTASGKSAVAMAVAEQLGDVELVSIDSMQVYRRMDIGTAKPTAEDRTRVRHHLIDLVEPSQEFTVAEFQRAYDDVMADLVERGRRSILVGGTGLYHRAVIDHLDLPGQWPEIRARLEGEALGSGPRRLHARLTDIDPTAAARMEPTNTRRIVRALEVCEGSGRPFSSFGPGLDDYPVTPVRQIGLRWDRATLGARIERRVHAMVADGLVAEVAAIAGSTGFSTSAAQALGYKEILAHLDGELSLDQAVERVIVRTRQFAVRQERWFRRDPRVEWVDASDDPVAAATPVVLAALDGRT